MRLTSLNPPARSVSSRTMHRAFRGYNHRLVISDNEFWDMQNMTGDYYPILSPRRKRLHLANYSGDTDGLFAKTQLLWVKADTEGPVDSQTGKYLQANLYYAGSLISNLHLTNTPKQFVSMGALVLIWPDKVVFNTSTLTLERIERSFTTQTTITYQLSRQDGTPYPVTDITASDTAPENPSDGDIWIDTSSTPHVLKVYSVYSEAWTEVFTTYIKIECLNVGWAFNKGDGVTITGSDIAALNNTHVVQSCGDDYIVVIGILDEVTQQTGSNITVSRTVPDMDFLTEHNNRVWGCSSANHEVYCCKLGDPYNWNVFDGLSTDSYAATIGSDGDFTGAVTYGNYVLFFKSDKVHYIQGDRPANFVIGEKALRGVEKGSEKSLTIVDEVLYYKSPEGVVAYTGSYPDNLYEPFGEIRYKNAVGGGARSKYYVSMQSVDDNSWHTLCFDTKKGLWYKEDDLHVTYFATWNNELWYMDDDNNFGTIFGTTGNNTSYIVVGETEEEGPIDWYVETGNIGLDLPDEKYVSRILIRMSVDTDTELSVLVQYDSSGIWTGARTVHTHSLNSFTIPVIPARCDHMKIRIQGTGACKIYSISKEIENGSELHGNL